jgi:hypothetical protein
MKMRHPKSGQVIDVLSGSERVYEVNGWRKVHPAKKSTSTSGARAAGKPTKSKERKS